MGLSVDHEIYLASLTDEAVEASSIQMLRVLCKDICIQKIPEGGLHVEKVLNWLKGMPAQVAYFSNQTALEGFNQFYAAVKPDAVVCQLLRMAPYTKHWAVPKIIDYMDAFAAGADRQAAKNNWKSFFWNSEAKRMRKMESGIFRSFQQHWIISDRDREELNLKKNELDQVKVIPNGIDTEFFSPAKEEATKIYDLVFVGNMGYLPNIQAAHYIIEEILPLLKKDGYTPSVLIAGARPPASLKKLENAQIKVSGWIDDIRDAYRAGKIFIAPLFTGSGLQNKLLEAMASGLPCITSSLAGEAIAGAKNAIQKKEHTQAKSIDTSNNTPDEQPRSGIRETEQKHLYNLHPALINADNAEDFATNIINLMENKKLREEAGIKARDFVERSYRWPIFINEINVNLKKLGNP